ncbi:hypothetical protein OKW38_002467 [Paraburkholderia sp. MM5496-R1]|uniref:hypothetical protein n=1 Tax=Paraburkholderia sp. MM5496-R1 TaxID=2991065 RepID=UPI003D25E163
MDPRVLRLVDKAIEQARRKRIRSESGYVPPATGYAYARFVGYYEMGKHEEEFEGRRRITDKVNLVFELSGPNHQPRVIEDGTVIPHRVTVQEALSGEHWSNFDKLFTMMNEAHGGFAVHMAELLGRPFIVEVFHRKSKDKVYANLKGPLGYNVQATGAVKVDEAATEIKAFIWDVADKAMWDDIYIPGYYEEEVKDEDGNVVTPKRSKNVIQERIMSAVNWPELSARLGI